MRRPQRVGPPRRTLRSLAARGAEPFASYDISGDDINHVSLNEAGTTYRHTFETTGEYTHVCVPHAASGMIGTIVVR
ncbi:plastocyanin/azurin family copper-binding protein [Haloplanus litoreus]|uniref:plastocyanin/azurin family copper-binding protein n=1 Tax=Haloplanus litoreus TaxID=767515 RepID=UPI00361E8121